MLERIMFWAILGHFVGDYLAQPKSWALGKTRSGWGGVETCISHCGLYSMLVWLLVVAGMGWWNHGINLLIIPMVFLTHYPIDRWSLADKWLRWIKGRRITDGLNNPDYRINPEYKMALMGMATTQAFAVIVYTVVDNTMHVVLMTVGFAALLHRGVI